MPFMFCMLFLFVYVSCVYGFYVVCMLFELFGPNGHRAGTSADNFGIENPILVASRAPLCFNDGIHVFFSQLFGELQLAVFSVHSKIQKSQFQFGSRSLI